VKNSRNRRKRKEEIGNNEIGKEGIQDRGKGMRDRLKAAGRKSLRQRWGINGRYFILFPQFL
jgi:hypothetical protein